MSTLELLSELRQLGVQLSTDGKKLKCKAPNDALTPRLKSALADCKAEIITFLHEGDQSLGSTVTQIPIADRTQPLPLSFSQQRLWFLDQIEPNSSSYNIPEAVQLTGALNISILQQAIETIVAQHEVIRTTYRTMPQGGGSATDGHPMQVINPPGAVAVEIIDLQQVPPTEQPARIQQYLHQASHQPFNLATDLMLRCCLLQLAPDQHIFLATMHHIASDAWSMGLFWQQLGQVYNALSQDQPNPLTQLPIQYADYAAWQREWLSSEILAQQLDYWKQQLTQVNPVLELPTDYPRPATQTYAGAISSIDLSPQLTTDLKALSRQEGATLFMTLLAAFQLLMSRHSGQEDFIIASPIAGRNRTEVEGSIGFFINTLLLNADLAGNPTFHELLGRVRKVALGAYSHQDVPFEKLIEELNPRRDLSRNPLFQVLFNMLNTEEVNLDLMGLTVAPVTITEVNSKFDVTLYAKESDSKIHLDLAYNTDLFTPARMAEMLDQFAYLLTQIVAQPDLHIHTYSLVTPAAQALLPDARVALPQPIYPPITTTILEWAARTPHHPAIVQADRTWTYQELVIAAQKIARSLQANHLAIGDAVAVSGGRSFGLIASMLGVLISGGVLVNIYPTLPVARQQLILSTANAKYLLAAGQIPFATELSSETQIFDVQPDTAEITTDQANHQIAIQVAEPIEPLPIDAAAYIFFTSGTTGTPKGVLGSHQGLAHFLAWQRETFAVVPTDRAAQLTGISFDVVMRDIFLPLTSGATLCMPSITEDLTAGKVLPWLERHQITLLHTVPTIIQSWLLNVPAGVSLPQLRQIFFAGEPLKHTLIQNWRATFPLAGEIVNLYGPTETTLAKCYYRVPAQLRPGVQPVGITLPATQALVVKPDRQLCGIGEAGEIAIRTPFRTKGYLNATPADQARFAPNPDRSAPDDLIYYTGDRGRYLPDGQLEILGRIDRQVKIAGIRIEPGEIAALLDQHPQIKTTVIIAREDIPGDKRLVAYYVTTHDQPIPTSELRQFLSQELPGYMVPSAFVLLAALPFTPNGKIDSRALPAPVRETEASPTFLAPRDEFEVQLTKIWERVLGVRSISVTDNFFELGGHSLLAIRLFSEIEQVWGKNLPLAILFQAQTIEQLADILRQEGWSAPYSSLVPIQPTGSNPPLFCVHPIGGNVLEYYGLASHLGKDQPVYGLQSLGLDGKEVPLRSIEAMAAHYITEMKIVQPHGPYLLVGYSFAGLVVYEIAQQLDRQGEQVALLALLDRISPTFVPCRSGSLTEILKIHSYNLSLLDFKGKLRYIIGRIKYRSIYKGSFREYMIGEWDNSLPPGYIDVFDANLQASDDYQGQGYAGNLTLFRCQVQPQNQALSPDLGWRDLVTGQVEIYPVAAPHYDLLLEPHVQSLAKQLQLCIDKAQTNNHLLVD
jgi:amino acid adenylation domain-containing protein